MNAKKEFLFKYDSEKDLMRFQKKIVNDRQKLKDAQNWDNFVKSNTNYNKNSISNSKEVQHNEPLFGEKSINDVNSHCSGDLYSLHDPHDLNHIHGLRNRLFKTFNEFSKILNNALVPPVLKVAKKVLVKIKESDLQINKCYISDLNSLLTEIKEESKNENLHTKKNKNNVMLKKKFQMKLIQCYKLSIDTIQICSKTLEAGIYHPIQSKMKNLIQIVSTLSLITRKYLYGELFKKKKKESYDLVQECKILEKMLDECDYKDMLNENDNNIQHKNVLNELANKALVKSKISSFSSNSKHLGIYMPTKPKLGSNYANKWSNKSLELLKNIVISDEHSCHKKSNDEFPIALKNDHIFCSYGTKPDEIKTQIEDYHCEDEIYDSCKETENNRFVYTNEEINLPTSTITLKSDNNVGLFIIKENIWRNFPLKNLSLSESGCLHLYISPRVVKDIYSYKQQFKQMSTEIRLQFLDVLFNVTESIMDDLIRETLSRIENKIIYDLLKMELLE